MSWDPRVSRAPNRAPELPTLYHLVPAPAWSPVTCTAQGRLPSVGSSRQGPGPQRDSKTCWALLLPPPQTALLCTFDLVNLQSLHGFHFPKLMRELSDHDTVYCDAAGPAIKNVTKKENKNHYIQASHACSSLLNSSTPESHKEKFKLTKLQSTTWFT